MRMLSVVAICLLLLSAEQLGAQTTEPPATVRDPFGSFGDASLPVEPNARPSVSNRTPKSADPPEKRVISEPGDLFDPVCSASAASASRQRIEQALNRETTFDYLEQPLKDVIDDISFSNGVPIIIDVQALEDHGISTDTPITRSLKGISLRSALRLAIQPVGLTFVLRDEVLQITTPEAAESAPSTRFYRVSELLPPNRDGQVLVELIKTLVAPDTWCGSKHVGSIVYIEHLESLAIRHTDEVFHEIEELLATTKRLAEMQPAKDLQPSGAGAILE